MSTESGQLFDQILIRLSKAINNYLVTSNDNKQIGPEQFIEEKFKKELSMLIHLSKINFHDALLLFLNAASRILKQVSSKDYKDFKQAQASSLCIYYTLATKCCNSTDHLISDHDESEELIKSDLTIKNLLIEQASFIYGDIPPDTMNVRIRFSAMISSFGAHYSAFYDFFFDYAAQSLNSGISSKNLSAVISPLMNLPGDSVGLKLFLEHLMPIVSSTQLKQMYKQQISDMIRNSILSSLKLHFINGSNGKRTFPSYPNIETLLNQLDSWNEKHGKFTWPTQVALIFLSESKFAPATKTKDSLFDCLSRFPDLKGYQKEPTLMALLVGFRIYALSCNNAIAREFMLSYYDQFLNYFLNSKSVYPTGTNWYKVAYTDFPICVLFFNKENHFKTKILPFLKEKSDGSYFIAKILRRLCQQASIIKDERMLDVFIEPTISIMKKAEGDSKSNGILELLISAFHSHPPFFRKLLLSFPQNIETVISCSGKHPELSWQKAFLSFFQSISTVNTLSAASSLLTFLFQTYCNVTLYSHTQFGDSIPLILRTAALCPVFQQEKIANLSSEKADDLKNIVKTLEASAILMFASSKKNWRRFGANALTDTLNMVHANSLTDTLNIEFPVDNYHLLTVEALKINPTTGHAIYKNPLRVINPSSASEGYSLAWEPLYQYFLALTSAMNPEIQVEQSNHVSAQLLPVSELTEEWIGCTSILFAITTSNAEQLFEQASILVRDPGDLGVYIVATIPTALNVSQYTNFMNSIVKWVNGLKRQGVFNVNNSTSCTIQNLMKIVRGLAEQKCWSKEMVNNNIDNFSRLMQDFVNFSSIVPDMECRNSCGQCIVSIAKLVATYDAIFAPAVRHDIAKTLLGWLSNSTNNTLENDSKLKQFFSIVQTALALLLDDLSLMDCTDPNDPKTPEEQAESQFMIYFVAIKQMLETNYKDQCSELIPVLAALLKQNLTLGIEHCISMGFSSPYEVRAAFIGSLASVFKIPEAKAAVADEMNENNTLIDVLYSNGFDLVEYIAGLVPYSRADAFGAASVEAAILKNVEFQFLERMIEVELRTIDENSKNTLFRGNAVPARAVGHYPRVVGTEWMIKTLRPLFDEVIANCEKKGWSYIVDPAKVASGDLEANKSHFRELMNKSIDVINDARGSMPPGLIRETQLIYRKVHEKYGDFAIQILGGFLFLRFLLPAFTVSKLVGLPELLPDAPRQALLQTCTMLMAAINKGSLEDKAEHFQCFNDIALRAFNTFNAMFIKIVETDIGDTKDNIVINEEKTITSLQNELWPLIPQITNAIANGTDADENGALRSDLERLIQKVQSMGEPKSTTSKTTAAPVKDEKAKGKSSLDSLLKMKFKVELLQQLSSFMVKEEQPATDGSAIYHLYMDRLDPVTKPAVVPYIIMKKLLEETNNRVTLVLFLNRFNESKIPAANLMKTYSEMQPAQKIIKYILLEPNDAFIQFATRNQQLFEKPHRFFQVSSLAEFTDLVGPTSKNLPITILESLTKPDSIQRAVVNRNSCNVRIHQKSIQFVSNTETVNSYKFSSIIVLLPTQIAGLKQKTNSLSFEIATKDGRLFNIEPKNSTLYDATSALFKRTSSLDQMINKVKKVDASTLQWLMLNLAFVNMVDEGVIPSVRKAALDLIYAVFSAFTFKRESKVAKLPMESLPENLLGFVTSLSEDIAVHNPESYAGFMTEFFNATHDISPMNRISTFNYLRPWISAWAADIETHPEFTINLVKAFLDLKEEAATFSLNIWDIVVKEDKAREYLMKHIYKTNNDALIQVITSFAVIKPAEVSKFWADTMIKECVASKDFRIVFVSRILTALLASHLFDTESSLVSLIHNVLYLRLVYPSGTLSLMVDLIGNIIHSLIRINKQSLDIDFTSVCEAFCSDGGLNEIVHIDAAPRGNQENPPDPDSISSKRQWLSRSKLLATTIRKALGDDEKTISALFDLFFTKVIPENNDAANLADSMIYASAFAGKNHAAEFAKRVIDLVKYRKNHTTLSAACVSLSMLEMTKELASKLFYFGISVAFYLQKGPSIDLIASAIKQFQPENDKECDISFAVSQTDVVQYLTKVLGMNFVKHPIYSALVTFAVYCDDEIGEAIDDVVQSGTNLPFAKVLSLYNSDEKFEEICDYDFGQEYATVAAASLMIVKFAGSQKSSLLDYILSLLETRPRIFGCFNAFSSFGLKILESVNSPTLAAQIYYASQDKSNDYKLASILCPFFTEGSTKIFLKKNQLDHVVDSLFG